jgi:hypothetical protein
MRRRLMAFALGAAVVAFGLGAAFVAANRAADDCAQSPRSAIDN